MLTTKLHHPAWKLVFLHAIGTSFAILGTAIVSIVAIFNWHPLVLTISWGGLLIYEILNFLLLTVIQNSIKRTENKTHCVSEKRILKWPFLIALPVTQFFYPFAALWALTTRSVTWRGIEYSVDRLNGKIKLKEYQPYSQTQSQSESVV